MVEDVRNSRWLPRAMWACATALLVVSVSTGVGAQQKVSTLRMYVMDMGGRPPGPRESTYPAFLIVHPSGRTLVWEAGALPDEYVGTNLPRTDLRDALQTIVTPKPLKTRLADIGYAPAQITFIAVSHYHDDHTGNAGAFTSATWLVQKAEHEAMFSGQPQRSMNIKTFGNLDKGKKVVIENKDYDVFGDGTAVIKWTPGHTQGGQALFVKLAKAGPVLLSGDIYHATAEHVPPFTEGTGIDVDKDLTVKTRLGLEEFLKQSKAALWIQHDVPTVKGLKHSPEYYE